MEKDEAIPSTEAFWDREVEKGEGSTIPWPDLDPDLVRQFAGGQLDPEPELLAKRATFYCIELADVEGKDVLCLAAGGGQRAH